MKPSYKDVQVAIEHSIGSDWNPPWYVVQTMAYFGDDWETERMLGGYFTEGPPRVWLAKRSADDRAAFLKRGTNKFKNCYDTRVVEIFSVVESETAKWLNYIHPKRHDQTSQTVYTSVDARVEHTNGRRDRFYKPPWYVVQCHPKINGGNWQTQRLAVYGGPPRVWLSRERALIRAWRLKRSTSYLVRVTAFGSE